MRSRKTELLRRPAALFFLLLMGVLLLLAAYQKQRWDSDIFWALKSGEWIVENMRVPRADPFSYTFAGRPWVDFTWGFQVIAWSFYKYLGAWTGLFILQVVVTAGIVASLGANLWLIASKRVWLIVALLYITLAMTAPRLYIRPHLFSYLFISLFLLLLNLYESKGKSVYLWLLLPLQVLWINIHSSFVLGIFIVGVYALGALVDVLLRRGTGAAVKELFTGHASRLVIVAALLPIVSLINPYGLRLVVFPFVHQAADNSDALKHIGEWARHPLREMFFYLYPFPLDHFAFLMLFLAGVLVMAFNYRRLKSRDIALVAAAVYMAATHMRWVAQFAYFAAPVLALNLSGLLGSECDREGATEAEYRPPRCGCARLLEVVSWACVLFLAGSVVYSFAKPPYIRNYGIGVNTSQYPIGTVEFMKQHSVKGKIYNEYIFGGYLIQNYPEVKVFIDGRTPTVYSSYFFWTARLTNDPRSWKKLVDRHGIDIALIKLNDPFCVKLHDNKDWSAVSFDDDSILYLRRGVKFDSLISERGLEDLNACVTGPMESLPGERAGLEGMRGELKRVLAEGGDAFARPHKLLGLVDIELGTEHLEEAVEELKKSIDILDRPATYYSLGMALGRLKQREEAIAAFRASIAKDKGFKDSYLALGLAHYDVRDYAQAVKYLKKYAFLADDGTGFLAYKTLGLSYFELGEYRPAVAYLKRAAFEGDETKEVAVVHYYLGSALFESGEIAEGVSHYSSAVEVDPAYAEVLARLATELKDAGFTEKASAILAIDGVE